MLHLAIVCSWYFKALQREVGLTGSTSDFTPEYAKVCTNVQGSHLLSAGGNAGQPRLTACPCAKLALRQQCPIGLARIWSSRHASLSASCLPCTPTPLPSGGEIDGFLILRGK